MLKSFFQNKSKGVVLISLLLSLFWVLFLWGAWQSPARAHGLNATIFSFGVLGLFTYWRGCKVFLSKKNLKWLIPIGLLCLSFALFESPFLKGVTLFVLPVIFGLFYNDLVHFESKKPFLSLANAFELFIRLPLSITCVNKAFASVKSFFDFRKIKSSKHVLHRILVGSLILIALASFLVIPLLSDVDAAFADRMGFVFEWIQDLFSLSWFKQLIILCVGTLLTLSTLYSWDTPILSFFPEAKKEQRDSIVGGIILGGILALYLIFIFSQVEQLWLKNLPIAFEQAEHLVKSGFWQLFFLSMLNVILFLIYYKKSQPALEYILRGFMVVSLFLVFSSAQRMFLYVTGYGFSYEKWFAAYTVLYSLVLFGYLLFTVFHSKQRDVIRFMLIAFLWMYSVMTILPVERLIFHANVSLSERVESRIDLNELSQLSGDVMDLAWDHFDIKNNPYWKGWVDYKKENRRHLWYSYQRNILEEDVEGDSYWVAWLVREKEVLRKKAFYEKNLSNLIWN